jgi:hypothetical protein
MTSAIREARAPAFGASLDRFLAGGLEAEREDIHFFDVAPGRVRIEVTVRNAGERRSMPTPAVISAAPLGAFVPWRPLTTLVVPPLEPGESAVLKTEVARAKTAPLGPPDRVPPRRLLTALGMEDDRPPRARSLAGGSGGATLPADLFDLMRTGNPHFAGNLNVFVGGRAVERHLAQQLRIYPGRTNLAMFVVGSGRDSYAFRITGLGTDWVATLYALSELDAPMIDVQNDSIVGESAWIDVVGTTMVMLVLRPPDDCRSESVEVHVTERSSGKEAVVEFGFDPQAAGPGCYVVG